MTEQKVNTGTRIGAMMLDHIAMTMIAMVFFIPGMITSFIKAFEITHEQNNPAIFGELSYIGVIGFALYFCKDCINGRSIAKRTLKLQVVDNLNGSVASPLKTFVRNIFIVIWPIEVIMTLINPNRRIGDYVAGTKVISFNPELEQPKINIGQIGLSLVLAIGITFVAMMPLQKAMSKLETTPISYVESSLNENAANEMMQLFSDSLGNYATADIRIYDQIKENKDLKYISVILRLKTNLLEYDDDFKKIESSTISLLHSKFPEETFIGQIKFVYQQPGSIISRTTILDWRRKE